MYIRTLVVLFLCNKKALLSEGIKKGPVSLLLSRLHTIVAVMMLNFRVRDGNGCVHHAIAARSSRDPSKPDTSSLLMITLTNLGQVLGLLVPPPQAHRCACTRGLSTSSSSRGLTCRQWEVSSWRGLHA